MNKDSLLVFTIMMGCNICTSCNHEAEQCNIVDHYANIVGRIFLDYREDRNEENLQNRLKEATKKWKNDLWYAVAWKVHHKVGAYISINTTCRFINHLKNATKSSYIQSFCDYYNLLEPSIYTDNENHHNDNHNDNHYPIKYQMCMVENSTAWYVDKICGICLEDQDGSKTIALTCNHTYCTDCIIQLLSNNQNSCPNCRSPLEKLYFCKDIHWKEFNNLQETISKN